jgi:hypothetical protein
MINLDIKEILGKKTVNTIYAFSDLGGRKMASQRASVNPLALFLKSSQQQVPS